MSRRPHRSSSRAGLGKDFLELLSIPVAELTGLLRLAAQLKVKQRRGVSHPLLQGRIPAICTDVTTVTTPGESVDIVVTDYGVAVNPRRPDLLEALKAADCVPLKTIEELRDIAYSIVGEPEKVQFGDRIVGIIEARDGTVMDVVREVKPFSFRED